MSSVKPMAFTGTSSAPSENSGSGAGSIMASMISRGVLVSRYTSQGTMRPFGEDTGSADDSTVTKPAQDR